MCAEEQDKRTEDVHNYLLNCKKYGSTTVAGHTIPDWQQGAQVSARLSRTKGILALTPILALKVKGFISLYC